MLKLIKIYFLLVITSSPALAEGIFGYWQIDFNGSDKPQTALLIYEYDGLVFGKVVAIYNKEGKIIDTPALKINKATGVEGTPPLCGLDIIWNLQKDDNKYSYGTVINPDTGNTYNCSIWLDKDKLVLRGEVLFFGEDKYLPKIQNKDLDPSCIIEKPKPNIPKLRFWSL